MKIKGSNNLYLKILSFELTYINNNLLLSTIFIRQVRKFFSHLSHSLHNDTIDIQSKTAFVIFISEL